VQNFLERVELLAALRRENIYAVGEKRGPVEARYPGCCTAEADESRRARRVRAIEDAVGWVQNLLERVELLADLRRENIYAAEGTFRPAVERS